MGKQVTMTLNIFFPIKPKVYELLSAADGGVYGSPCSSFIIPSAAANSVDSADPSNYVFFVREGGLLYSHHGFAIRLDR